MKIKLNKGQWEAMGKKAGWMGTVKTASDYEGHYLLQFKNELENGNILVKDLVNPPAGKPYINYVLTSLQNDGVNIAGSLKEIESNYKVANPSLSIASLDLKTMLEMPIAAHLKSEIYKYFNSDELSNRTNRPATGKDYDDSKESLLKFQDGRQIGD